MSDVVTGEAVLLDLRVARLASRALAVALDLALQLGVLLLGALALGALSPLLDDALAAVLALLLVVGTLVGYPVACEALSRGRTVGKLALGLRAVRDDGSPIRFRHALVRGVMGFVEIYLLFGIPAVLVSLANARGKRVGDLLAGTVVVRERVPVESGAGAPLAPPPFLAGWAAGADLSALPDDLALAARQFLVRTRQLSPQARASMGARIATDVAARTAPPPPPGTHPEAFLAAVLAERSRRAYLRSMPTSGPAPFPSAAPAAFPSAAPAPLPSAAPAAAAPAAPAPAPGPFAPPG